MGKHRFQNATLFLCILMLTFASWAWAQEQTNPAPQAGAKPAKEQLKPEEPEILALVRKPCGKQHRTRLLA